MANFPDDILMEILARLPVKSILRFRCANKAWCKLLKDRKFVQKHLNRATEMNRFSLLIDSSGKNTMVYDPSSSILSRPVETKCPVRCSDGTEVFGYCNGLVCISSGGRLVVFLWNLTTQEYKKLPLPQLHYGRRHICGIEYGFGYDYKIDDFKVVFIVSYRDEPGIAVHVYTLRCDSWRYVGEFPYDIFQYPRMSDIARVPVNGALHWLAVVDREDIDDSCQAIVYFDFEKETFEKMALPKFAEFDDTVNYKKHVCRLCVLGGSLCLMCSNREDSIDVWQLDNETRNCWAKLFTVDQQKLFGIVADWMPLRSFENGRVILALQKKDASFNGKGVGLHMIMYDPKDESSEPLGSFQFRWKCLLRTSACVESLVSLNSGTYLWQGQVKLPKEEDEYYLDFKEEDEEEDEDEYSEEEEGEDEYSEEEDEDIGTRASYSSEEDEDDDSEFDDEHIGTRASYSSEEDEDDD